jgi:hypothetical protein
MWGKVSFAFGKGLSISLKLCTYSRSDYKIQGDKRGECKFCASLNESLSLTLEGAWVCSYDSSLW